MDYTPAQIQAINTIDNNLQIIACAGSGKTQVISARIIEILKQKSREGIRPGNIIAFTFTEKAAGELKDRIYLLAQQVLGSNHGLAEMFVGTIHGYCLNLLQSPPLYRFLKYGVLNEVQQRLFIDRHSASSGLTHVPLLNGGRLVRWRDSRLYQQLLEILSEGNVDITRVPEGVRTAVSEYSNLLHQKKYLDYSTIISEAVAEIMSNAVLRDKLTAEVRYLVVDEYQDVNPLQELLIQQFRDLGANICVVGDDDQTIYQWRGSDVTNIISFTENYPAVEQIPLNDNFRSSGGIVDTARRVVEHNGERLPKEMISSSHQTFEHGDILAVGFPDPTAEAAWIPQKIRLLYGTAFRDRPDSDPRGLTYSDFAILLRSVKNDGDFITSYLERANIPYIVVGMHNLFDTEEIKAMVAVYYYLADYIPQNDQPYNRQRLQNILQNTPFALTPQQLDAGLDFLAAQKAKIGPVIIQELILQRLYQDFLASLDLREEAIDAAAGRQGIGEIIYYNLGKFSQLISDYEQIHFNTPSRDQYTNFAGFLCYQAPDYYPEGWQENGFARPDAIQVMTVHQAKGMQWPVVFVPCLRNNRFPSGRRGGRSVWNIIPEDSVQNADRYKGTLEDERRLFYVAITRAEKYLFCTWSPIEENRQQRNISIFMNELTASQSVLTRDPNAPLPPALPPRPRRQDITIPLTFSQLKYYFECPYQFKLKFLYGFNPPIDQALGYGKSLHDALAEIHSESIRNNVPTPQDVPRLVDDHLHLPFASQQIRDSLRSGALKSLTRYIKEHQEDLHHLEHVEKIVELKLEEGIVVNGRIDLIRRIDTGEVVVVDFKSNERAQAEDITIKQLHVYAVGYEQLSGQRAAMIEIHNMEQGGAMREIVDQDMVSDTLGIIAQAGADLRVNNLPRLRDYCEICGRCDVIGVCRDRSVPAN